MLVIQMNVIDKRQGELVSLCAKELNRTQLKALTSKLAGTILKELAQSPTYPKDLARRLKLHEQKIYYHIRRLEKAGIIEILRTKTIGGTAASIYGLTEPAFVIKYTDFEKTQRIVDSERLPKQFLDPFIDNGKLNAKIIVGSPDPHGPEKARSRDGYYGIDLALFLGTYLNNATKLNVKLDTEVRQEDLQENLILIGGPVVNTITDRINPKLPIRFEQEQNWGIFSTISGKIYHSDETGVIEKVRSPFNPKKSILVVAGKRYSGTRSVMIAFLQRFAQILEGNKFNDKIPAKVVEGIDLDSDGVVDDVEFLE